MKRFSYPVLRRLPRYYQLLITRQEQGWEFVSSENLARSLNVDASLVRKDLAGIETGLPKVGYHIPATLWKIRGILGMNNINEALLVGAGSLGRALLGYDEFKQYGLRILAAFDNDERKIGQLMAGVEVLPVNKLENIMSRLKVNIGIITVPPKAAQEVADRMVRGGVVAIWNFAPVSLRVTEKVIVKNENLAAGFALLSHDLLQRLSQLSEPLEASVFNREESGLKQQLRSNSLMEVD